MQQSTPPSDEVAEFDSQAPKDLRDILAADNICEMLGNRLGELASWLGSGIDKDKQSMRPWLKKYNRAIKRARLEPENADKNFPFADASNVVLPYLLDAAIDFNSRATPALLERKDICYIAVYGEDEHPPIDTSMVGQLPPEMQAQVQQLIDQMQSQPTPKQARAERVSTMMNYDLATGIPGWRESVDKAMMLLPLVGTYFKKTYQCPTSGKRKSELIYPDKLIFDHESQYFEKAPRKSFEYTMSKNEVLTAIRSGQFVDIELSEEEESLDFIESHCELDLDEDGFKEPYIAVICTRDDQIVSIIPRYAEEDIQTNKDGQVVHIDGEEFFTQTIFMPDPSGTCMGMGYGILLADMFDVIDTNTNQMIDAGTLNNVAANSGFIRAGARMGPRAGNRQKKGTIDMQLGKFTTWESSGTSPLQNDIAQLPFSGPSAALGTLLEQLKGEVREMVALNQSVDDSPQQAASMYLAKLHEALRRPNSIMVRVFDGLTKEFKRIYDVQRRYLTDEEYREVLDIPEASTEADYDPDVDIETTADPTQGSDMERIARAEMMLTRALENPAAHDVRYAYQQYYLANGVKDIEKLLPPPQTGEPDPIQIMQAQSMQQMSQAEMMKGEADLITAQARLLQANIDMVKLDYEIEEIESKTMKNLSEVDKNESETVLKQLKSQRDDLRELINATQIRTTGLAKPASNQAIPASPGQRMPQNEAGTV